MTTYPTKDEEFEATALKIWVDGVYGPRFMCPVGYALDIKKAIEAPLLARIGALKSQAPIAERELAAAQERIKMLEEVLDVNGLASLSHLKLAQRIRDLEVEISALKAQMAEQEPGDNYCWLLEIRPEFLNRPEYLADGTSMEETTTNPYKALRFPTEKSASICRMAVLTGSIAGRLFPVQHCFTSILHPAAIPEGMVLVPKEPTAAP